MTGEPVVLTTYRGHPMWGRRSVNGSRPDTYGGEIVIVSLLPEQRVRVEHADPQIRAAAGFLDQLQEHHHPDATFDGHLLRIQGVNRTVIYRVEGYDSARDEVLLAWPD